MILEPYFVSLDSFQQNHLESKVLGVTVYGQMKNPIGKFFSFDYDNNYALIRTDSFGLKYIKPYLLYVKINPDFDPNNCSIID